MRSKAFLSVVWAVWSAGSAWGAAPTSSASAGWLAYGDLRGHVEPCGCDPATDMGGIRRITAVIERERARAEKIGVFVLGNNLPQAGMHPVKIPFLLEADALNRPTASLVNELELGQLEKLRAFAKSSPKEFAALQLVLSNQKKPAGLGLDVKPEIDDGQFIVLGYTWSPAFAGRLERVSPAMIKEWTGRLGAANGRHKVLLFAGPSEDLATIAKAKIFSSIISSNASPMSKDPGVEEKKDEGLLRRVADPAVYAVPLGGQGLLRGGALMFEEAKPLSAYLGDTPKVGSGDELFKAAKRVTWLDITTGESEAAKALYRRYDEAVKAEFKNASATRLKDLATSPFAGASACVSCHKAASDVYQASKHAQAIETLKAKNKHEDGECVACHTVGATVKGGFVSLAASPQLANAQCENCHGPRKEHVADPSKSPMPKTKAMDVCVSCHNTQHSPAFDLKEYWGRIKHQ